MVSLDLIDIAAAIEAEGWCGAQDIHGPVIIVAEDNDASDLPSEAWEHINAWYWANLKEEGNRIAFYAQNEDVDEDGFYTNSHAAEIEALREMGAPDLDRLKILSIEPEDRDEAIVEAECTLAFAKWANENLDILEL